MKNDYKRVKMNEMNSENVGFIVPVKVEFINERIGWGVFTKEKIKKGTLLWTPKLIKWHSESDCRAKLSLMTLEKANVWLRQTFVYSDHLDFLCSNEDDDGRFVNHSSSPNTGCASSSAPSVSLRDIEENEELTCDYGGLGSPFWYKDLCKLYNVIPTDEITSKN